VSKRRESAASLGEVSIEPGRTEAVTGGKPSNSIVTDKGGKSHPYGTVLPGRGGQRILMSAGPNHQNTRRKVGICGGGDNTKVNSQASIGHREGAKTGKLQPHPAGRQGGETAGDL